MQDLRFKINKEDGRITGFTLLGIGNTEAEEFGFSFLRALELQKAEVVFEGNEIVFKHRGISLEEADPKQGIYGTSEGGEFRQEISPEEKEQLSHLLELTGPYCGHKIFAKQELAWGKGFTVYVKKNNQ